MRGADGGWWGEPRGAGFRAEARRRACAASSSAPCAPTATASACVRCSDSCKNASSAAASAAVRAALASCSDPCRLLSSCSAAW